MLRSLTFLTNTENMILMDQRQVINLLKQQKNQQWGFFLHALAHVLAQQLSEADLHSLMYSIGLEAAKEIPVEGVSTVQELEKALNQFWFEVQWGIVELKEVDSKLQIEHACSPLLAMFGEDACVWVTGFLEAIYYAVFQRLGAGEELKVKWVDQENKSVFYFLLGA